MIKKALYFLVALVMVAAVFSGCNTDKDAAGDKTADPEKTAAVSEEATSETEVTEEPYKVHFAYHAPKEGNEGKVEELITELALEELNMEVDLIPIGWDTYNTKFPAMLAAQEPMDISFMFTFSAASFLDAGYIVDAADYTDYTKDIYEILGDDVKVGYIGDMLVGFPMLNSRAAPSAVFVRQDIFEELGYSEDDFSVTTDDMSSFDQITEMLEKVKENYPSMVPFDGHRIFGQNGLTYIDGLGSNFGVLEDYGQTTTITNWYESEQFKSFALLARQWFESGLTSKDIAVEQELGQAKMRAGNAAAFFASYTANALTAVKAETGYDCVMIPVSQKMKSTMTVNAALNCVLYQSEDKAKAFEFLNWTYTSADFNDYLNWGVPGEDWVINEDGLADYPEGETGATVNYHAGFGFIYPNQFLTHPWAGSSPDVWEEYKRFDDDDLISLAYGFTYDPVNVANEEALCNTVLAKYESDICFGAVDVVPALEAFNEELYAAGLQTIMDEKQSQLDAWLANQN